MARFGWGFRTTATSNTVLEIIGAANARLRLVEIGVACTAATITPLGVGFAAAQGITPTAPVTLLSGADNSTTTVTAALAWVTAPTVPTYFFRRSTMPAVIGVPLVWTWPTGYGIQLLSSTSIVLWLFAVGSTLDGWIVLEE